MILHYLEPKLIKNDTMGVSENLSYSPPTWLLLLRSTSSVTKMVETKKPGVELGGDWSRIPENIGVSNLPRHNTFT